MIKINLCAVTMVRLFKQQVNEIGTTDNCQSSERAGDGVKINGRMVLNIVYFYKSSLVEPLLQKAAGRYMAF
jgi:hypothetical protein